MDANDNLQLDDGLEPSSVTDNRGYYRVTYLQGGFVQAQRSSGYRCVDSISSNPLSSALRSIVSASMITPLTTVAAALQRAAQVGVENASAVVCANLVPCVSCHADADMHSSLQGCNLQTGCLETCVKRGAPLSVFTFDALNTFVRGDLPDMAWTAWMVGQITTLDTIECAVESLECASRDVCGSRCEAHCGGTVGNLTGAQLNDEVLTTLAGIVREGPVALENVTGAPIAQLILSTATRLGISAQRVPEISHSCGQTNQATYQELTSTSRRRLHQSALLPIIRSKSIASGLPHDTTSGGARRLVRPISS